MNHETIRLSWEGDVAVIRLHRPDRLNAYTVQMGAELFGALRDLDEGGKARAAVITGEGRAFCAGADLDAGGETFAGKNRWEETEALADRISPWSRSLPVIAAINGPAVGIGASMLLWWDIRLAAEEARIGFVFVRRGITPEAHSTWLLPRLIGASRAAELLLTGRLIDAQEALAAGLVSRVLPQRDLLPAALDLAQQIARQTAPVSVAMTRRLLFRQLGEPDFHRAKRREDRVFRWSGAQPDAAEGVESFLQKRSPAWRMAAPRDLPPWFDEEME